MPTQPLVTFAPTVNEGGPVDATSQVPPDLSCLGKPSPEVPSTAPITVSGVVRDFPSNMPVGSVTVAAYATVDFTKPPYATTTADPSTGAYSIVAPAGTTYLHFKVTGCGVAPTGTVYELLPKTTASYSLDVRVMAPVTLQEIAAAAQVTLIPGTTIIAGLAEDCGLNPMEYAVATARSTSGSPFTGLQPFYFSGVRTPIPTPYSKQQSTGGNGEFVVAQIPAAGGQVRAQAYGLTPGGTTVTQIADMTLPVFADGITFVKLRPYVP